MSAAMEAPYFFHSPLHCGSLSLSREESAHAAGARRLRPGDELVLVDGQGAASRAVVLRGRSDGLEVEVSRVERRRRPALACLTLVTALPKGKRQDYVFEKCAELGVGRLVAVNFSRSVVRADSRRLEGWARTCREAIKQSRQAWAPKLEVCDSLRQLIENAPAPAQRWLAVPGKDVPRIGVMPASPIDRRAVWAVIGPEGGLSDQEESLLADAGFRPISLGPSLLRIETACVVLACHLQAHLA